MSEPDDHPRGRGRRGQGVAVSNRQKPRARSPPRAPAALADLDRDAFLMREVVGLSYEEIGKACGLTPDAVRSRIHRARLQLREALAGPIATRQTIPMRQSGR